LSLSVKVLVVGPRSRSEWSSIVEIMLELQQIDAFKGWLEVNYAD
jgi:hypothetical protein